MPGIILHFTASSISEGTDVKVARMASSGEDWRKGKNIVECNRYMLDNQIHTDVIFSVKSTQIMAHRVILISRSPVLEAKLSVRQPSEIIQIDHIEPNVFKKMLRYFYILILMCIMQGKNKTVVLQEV